MKKIKVIWYSFRPWLFILFGIGMSIAAIFAFTLTGPSNIIAVVGSSASVVGIAITMAQVSSIKKEVKKNSESIRTSHDISDFRKAVGWIDGILHAITLKEYGLAHSKTADLVSFLVEKKSNTHLDTPKEKEWDCCIDSLTIDTQNLYKKMNDQSFNLNIMVISKNLEYARKMVATINGNLDNKGYES